MATSAAAASLPLGGLRAAFARDKYIVSPAFDWLFFLGSPLLAVAAVHAALEVLPAPRVEGYVLTYMALGHHVPTFLRAYGDPQEFSRNRFKLLAIPALVVPLIALMYLIDSRLLAMVFLWDQFHFVRQHYGFMRIYDAKIGRIARSGNNLDQWLSFTWFAAILAHSDFYSFGYLGSFTDLGVLFPAGTGAFVRQASLAAAIGVGVLYAGDLVRRTASGEPVSLLKLCITATSYATWYYAYVVLSDLFLSYAISSLFHCLQYDALAWYYNVKKADSIREPGQSRIFRAVHRRGRVWLYAGAILAYPVFCQVAGTALPGAVYVLNRTTGILHYYFDSFIWRVRRPDFRAHL
jgi:hypothetical protein